MVTHFILLSSMEERLMSLDRDQHGLGYFQTLVYGWGSLKTANGIPAKMDGLQKKKLTVFV